MSGFPAYPPYPPGGLARRRSSTARATIALVTEDPSGSTTDGLAFDTAVIDFVAGRPLILGIASSQAGASGQTPASVVVDPDGVALAFTQVGSAVDVTVSPSRRMTVWRVTPQATFSAIVRVSFVTTNQTSCVWIPVHGVGVSGATPVQQASNPVTGTGPAAAAGALAAFEHSNNACLAFFLTASATAAPADGEAELSEQAQTSTTLNLQAQWKINDPTAAATLSAAAAYAAISLELRAA